MPSNNMNVGRDCSIAIVHPLVPTAGGRLDLRHITGFEPKQGTTAVGVKRLDGLFLGAFLPNNWSGNIDIERGNAVLDQFISAIELAYRTGVNIPNGVIYQYVTETDGTTSTWQFDNVAFHMPGAGAWKDDQTVKQQLGWVASHRNPV